MTPKNPVKSAAKAKARAATHQQILDLHARGLGNREIQRELGLVNGTVSRHLAEDGLTTNNPRGVPPVYIDENLGLCNTCQKPTPWADFALMQNGRDGRRLSKCKKCRAQQNYANLENNPAAYFNDRQGRIQRRAEKDGIPFDLPKGYLHQLWELQGGRCIYTDEELVIRVGGNDWRENRSDAISVDKVEPDKGYMVGNVVLCSCRANTIKHNQTLEELAAWMPTWYARVVSRVSP